MARESDVLTPANCPGLLVFVRGQTVPHPAPPCRTWRAAATLPRGELPFRYHILGMGSALIAFSSDTKGTQKSLL